MDEPVFPRRTHSTDLSDDVLLIFDALYDGDWTLHELRRESYRQQLNVPYTHSLDLLELEKTLNELVAGELLETYDDPSGGRRYGLTEEGGRLWELEREPPWDAYCQDQRIPGDDPLEAWVIVKAFSLETAREFLEAADHCGLYAIDPDSWEEGVIEGETLLPWKCCPIIYTVQASYVEAGGEIDWDSYEQDRTWWRSIGEMLTLAA